MRTQWQLPWRTLGVIVVKMMYASSIVPCSVHWHHCRLWLSKVWARAIPMRRHQRHFAKALREQLLWITRWSRTFQSQSRIPQAWKTSKLNSNAHLSCRPSPQLLLISQAPLPWVLIRLDCQISLAQLGPPASYRRCIAAWEVPPIRLFWAQIWSRLFKKSLTLSIRTQIIRSESMIGFLLWYGCLLLYFMWLTCV